MIDNKKTPSGIPGSATSEEDAVSRTQNGAATDIIAGIDDEINITLTQQKSPVWTRALEPEERELRDTSSTEDNLNIEDANQETAPEDEGGSFLAEVADGIANAIDMAAGEWERMEDLYQQEQLAADAPNSRMNVLAVIKANGGINYRALKERYGPVDADALRKKLGPGAFSRKSLDGRKTGLNLDEFVAVLAHEGAVFESGDEIFELLASDEGVTRRSVDEAYRKGIEEGKATAGRFMEIYEAWKAAGLPDMDPGVINAGARAVEAIAQLTTGNAELTRTIEALSSRVANLTGDVAEQRERADSNREIGERALEKKRERERELDVLARVAGAMIKNEARLEAQKNKAKDKAQGKIDDLTIQRNINRVIGRIEKAELKAMLRNTESRRRIADALAARRKQMIESIKEKQKLKDETARLLHQMERAANSKSVDWDRRQQIKDILSSVNTKDRDRRTARKSLTFGEEVNRGDEVWHAATDKERRAEIERLIDELGKKEGTAAAEAEGFTKKDFDLLKLSSMDKVSIEELRAIREEVKMLEDIGRREMKEARALEHEEVLRQAEAMLGTLGKDTAGRPPVIFGAGAAKKQYSFAAAKNDAIRREQSSALLDLEDEIINGLDLSPEEYAERKQQIMIDAARLVDAQGAGKNLKRGLGRKFEYLTDHIMMVIADRHRLFDLLDGGLAKFSGAFTKFWVSDMNRARNEMLNGISDRTGAVFENKLEKLGLTKARLYDQVKIEGDDAYSLFLTNMPSKWNLIGMYALSKDEDARRSLINGNLNGSPYPESFLTRLISELSQEEKALGDFIFDDMNSAEKFEELNRTLIRTTGEGMTKVENYVRIYRVERNPFVAEMNVNGTISQVDSRGRPEKLDPGFTKERVKASTAIETDLLKIWTRAVREQEHFISHAAALKTARAALFAADPNNARQSLASAINEKYGSYVLRRVIEEYNNLAVPDIMKAQNVFDGVLGKFISNKAISALSWNAATWLKNFASTTKWFVAANPIDIMASLHDYTHDREGFYNRVFALDPQLAQRKGSVVQTMMQDSGGQSTTTLEDATLAAFGQKARERVRAFQEMGMAPNSMIDRMVASIMFDSTYRSGLRLNMTSEEAADRAQRTVQRLMQPSDAMELPSLYKQGGLWRTLLLFSTEAMKNTNMFWYDFPRMILSGSYADGIRIFMTLFLSAVVLRALVNGIPALGDAPDGDEGEDDEEMLDFLFRAGIDGTVGQIPAIGGEIMDAIEGNHYSDDHTVVTDPFWQIFNGAAKIAQGERDEDESPKAKLMRNGYTKKEYGALTMAQGFAALSGAPWNQVKRLYTTRDAHDAADTLGVILGNRQAIKRAQRNAKERNIANW
ncbi:MAG: hypothetical protein LBT23_05625 [Synergistaceae bacterium]|nr:hypothetical protein [Synergistaceae bacterium]